jgi:serine/threonine protein kinase
VELDDCMMIEDDDILFLSHGEDFISPTTAFSKHMDASDMATDAFEDRPEKDKIPVVIGGYSVGKLLGRGAFGEVRVGVHQLTGEKVALKFLRKADIHSIGAAERTTTEIQCLSTLKHQNIIRLQNVSLPFLTIDRRYFWLIHILPYSFMNDLPQ